jgi:hypothetical protein
MGQFMKNPANPISAYEQPHGVSLVSHDGEGEKQLP